ncbi:hypothetical protein ACLBXM_20200 [Xanthobacteraceae bacterium A53D]
MRFACVAALLVATSLAGCQTLEKYTFATAPGQQVVTRQGRESVLSQQKSSTVILAPSSRAQVAGARPQFVAIITNTGKSPEEFRYANVSVTNAVADVPLKVYSLDELQTEARNAAIASAIIIGAVGVAASAAAANAATYRSGSGTVYGPYGASSYRWTSYNPAAGAAVAAAGGAATGAAVAGQLAQGEQNIQALETSMLMDNTVMPGETYGGALVFEPIRNDAGGNEQKAYVIRVVVGNDVHTFATTATQVRPSS